MERTERFEDPQEAIRTALDGRQSQMWTALPGIVVAYNASEGTVDVQPALMGQLTQPTGATTQVMMPKLIHCPLHFPSAGGYTMTFPVKPGDECLIVFASRCIDGWWDKGGVQKQAELRMHDLSDGFAILGTRSKVRALANASASGAQLRTDDGKSYIEVAGGAGPAGTAGVAPTGSQPGEISILATGDITITSRARVTIVSFGDVSVHASGVANISAGGDVILNNGQAMVARVGDTVQCPAGVGHITSGAARVRA
jgi:hypothetical protein